MNSKLLNFRKYLIILLLLFVFPISLAQTIHYPNVYFQYYGDIIIEKIELTDKNTILYLRHFANDKYINGGWVSISKDTYISTDKDSKKLYLIDAEGIYLSPNKYEYSSIYDELSFKLIFPPIGEANSINMIECEDNEKCFNFKKISISSSNYGVTQRLYYDENYMVVPTKETAHFYTTYTQDKSGKLIDYIRLYEINTNYPIHKYEGDFVSNVAMFYNIFDGEKISYDTFGNITRKTLIRNPNKIQYIDYLYSKNDIRYDFDTNGRLEKYTEYINNVEAKVVRYNSNQEIIYASDINDKYYFAGNPSAGYELVYQEDFDESGGMWGKFEVRDYDLGKTSYNNDGYLMESRNNGGVSEVFDIDFDMNSSDWVISTRFDRISSIEGAGIVLGSDNSANTFQLFLISGDGHFNHFNIYNGFNISSLDKWMFSNAIRLHNSRNSLSIMKMSDQIFVSVQGKTIYKTEFTKLSSSNVGVFVDKEGNKINFQSLTIKKLNSGIPEKFYSPLNYDANNSDFTANGSGFLINNSGYIATNHHVIDGSSEIFVEINGDDYKCKVVSVDKENDLAVLKVIDDVRFNVVSSINSNKSETGSSIFVLGFPYALSLLGSEVKLTDGKISSQSGFQGYSKTYQISAPIQPGNSGGPLFNDDGDVIGVVSSKFTEGENVGYAIKSDYLLNLLESNNINYNKNNSIQSLSLVEKVELLSKTTLLIKVK